MSRTKDSLSSPELDVKPLNAGIIWRLFKYTQPHRLTRNGLLVIVLVRAAQLPSLAWAIGAIINGPISGGNSRGLLLGCVGYILLAIFTQCLMVVRMRLGLTLGERVIHDLRAQLFGHVLTMPLSFFNHIPRGRLLNRMTTDVESVRSGVQDVFFVGCVQFGQGLIAALMMLWIDYRLFLVVGSMSPVVWWLSYRFRKRMSEVSRASQESFSRITTSLAESVNGIRVTQGFARQSVNAERFNKLNDDHSLISLRSARTSAFFQPLLELSSQLVTAFLVLAGGILTLDVAHSLSVGILIQFFFLSAVLFGAIQNLGMLYNRAMQAMAGAERVFQLLDTLPEWADSPTAVALPDVKGRVEARGLSFGYDPAQPVLREVNFVAEPGQTIALVGHTGSGKTSIINLIAKFYLPTSGEILIDGRPIQEIRSDSLHQHMAIIHQQNILFSGTVMDNIQFGKPDATRDEMLEVAAKLDCLDILEGLPQGLLTPVGENGAGLSLGQRQIICFIRAMLADPRILILDEATSSVDKMTELKIQAALLRLVKQRTCFVVAHRLSTIRHADQILVLDRGRIIEQGTHTGLLAQKGTYSELYLQFSRLGLGGSQVG